MLSENYIKSKEIKLIMVARRRNVTFIVICKWVLDMYNHSRPHAHRTDVERSRGVGGARMCRDDAHRRGRPVSKKNVTSRDYLVFLRL